MPVKRYMQYKGKQQIDLKQSKRKEMSGISDESILRRVTKEIMEIVKGRKF